MVAASATKAAAASSSRPRSVNSSDSGSSATARSQHVVAISGVRAAGGSQNSSSSARWTSVPLTAGTDGGSGRWSMAENRNANAQSLNVDTLEGDNEDGSCRAMRASYA